MSASLQEHEFPTISSSGHTDGLGRRVLAFDRESGVLTEHLVLRPELTAFAAGIQQRLDALAVLTDSRFATPGTIARHDGELTVVSEFVSGSRLSDLLDLATERGLVPGVDGALSYLLDALEGLAALHTTCRVPHGLIAPARTIITADGRVVFLDGLYPAVVERLGLSATRLWKDFRVAAIGRPRGVKLDPASDVAQVALGAVMLILGRNLEEDEFPTRIGALVGDVYEVAQIRGSAAFADGLRGFLERALPRPGGAYYADAVAALADVRALVESELGAGSCRAALAEFVAQTADGGSDATDGVGYADDGVGDTDDGQWDVDAELDRSAKAAPGIETPPSTDAEADDEAEALRALLASGTLDTPETPATADVEAGDDGDEEEEDFEFEIQLKTPSRKGAGASPSVDDAEHEAAPPPGADEEDEPPPNVFDLSGNDVDLAIMDRFGFGLKMPPKPEPKPFVLPEEPLPAAASSAAAAAPAEEAAAPAADTASGSRSRRKRQEKKSARARKDKLRSTVAAAEQLQGQTDDGTGSAPPAPPSPTAAAATPALPLPVMTAAPAAPPAQGGWLVPPEKAAQFDPVATPGPSPHPPVFAPPPPPARPVTPSLPPVAIMSFPSTPASPTVPSLPASTPRFTTPPAARPPAVSTSPPAATPVPEALSPLSAGAVSKLATLKLKDAPAPGVTPKRKRQGPSAPAAHLPPVVPLGYGPSPGADTSARGFPKRLALVLLIVVAAAIVAGRAYIAGRQHEADTLEATEAAATAAAAVAAGPAATGTVKVQSQPEGARVLLDNHQVGRTPLTITDVAPGPHTITLESNSATVSRAVRVAAGQSIDLDVPLFSGWVAIYAPIVLHVSERGRALGTTEEGRLMLAPGRHQLTLANTELGYRTVQNVDVSAGETATLRVTPTGEANINALPWAEVFVDGKRLGDTPLARVSLPLGSREVVFRNPQYGEQRVTVLIRGNQSTPVSVDLRK